MPRLVECIPNFSEGRDRAVIDALSLAAQKVPGVTLLDVQADEGHNRSVLTLVGSPEGMEEAAVALAKAAAARIDLRRHSGEHPRMGAVDVIPFVPVMDERRQPAADVAAARNARQIIEFAQQPPHPRPRAVFVNAFHADVALGEGRRVEHLGEKLL